MLGPCFSCFSVYARIQNNINTAKSFTRNEIKEFQQLKNHLSQKSLLKSIHAYNFVTKNLVLGYKPTTLVEMEICTYTKIKIFHRYSLNTLSRF